MVYRDWLHEWTWREEWKKSHRDEQKAAWLIKVRYCPKGCFFERYAPDSFLERVWTFLMDFVEGMGVPFICLILLIVIYMILIFSWR